jgi:flagellar hook assembly protein FlgD
LRGDIEGKILQVVPPVFDPEGSSGPNFVTVQYSLEQAGWVGSFTIYSAAGREVVVLGQQQILGTSGVYSWSGTDAAGSRVRPGYYEFELQIPFQFSWVTNETALSLGIKGTAVADGVYFLQEHFSNTGALTNLLLAAAVTNTVSSGRVQTNWRQNQTSQSLNTSSLVSQMDSITSGSRYGVYRARGWVNITTQGTFFPAASISGGGNGYIKAGAYAKITPLPSSESGYWSSQT